MNLSLHPAFSVIVQRAKEKSKPGKRSDSFKVGLVIEGGAMKGVVSAGMLVALEKLGFRDSFDIVYGTSIGAGNAAWFLANQIDSTITAYFENINNFSFINPLRVLRRRPIMSIDNLEKVIDEEFPLDFEEIKKSGIEFKIMTTRVDADCEKQNPLLCLSEFNNREDLISALKAAVQLPFIAGKPYLYKGMSCWDGGLIERIPLQTAIVDGCTHILVLLNRRNAKPRAGLIQKIIASYLKKYNPKIIPFFLQSYEKWRKDLEIIEQKEKDKTPYPYIARIVPSLNFKTPNGYELRHKVLLNAAKEGMNAVLKAFELKEFRVEEELTLKPVS